MSEKRGKKWTKSDAFILASLVDNSPRHQRTLLFSRHFPNKTYNQCMKKYYDDRRKSKYSVDLKILGNEKTKCIFNDVAEMVCNGVISRERTFQIVTKHGIKNEDVVNITNLLEPILKSCRATIPHSQSPLHTPQVPVHDHVEQIFHQPDSDETDEWLNQIPLLSELIADQMFEESQ